MKKITLPIAILLIAFLGCCDPQPDPPVVDNAYLILGGWWQEGVDAFQDDTLIVQSQNFNQDSTVIFTFEPGGDLVAQYFADTVYYWSYDLSGDSLQYLKIVTDGGVYDYEIHVLNNQDLKYMRKNQNVTLFYRWKKIN